MPIDSYGKPDAETLQLEDVQRGVNYAIVISTNAGLWRYIVGDTIQFVSVNPFRIKVTGRLKHFINAFGEEVIVDNADMAISKASTLTNAKVNDYTACPIYFSEKGNGSHEWAVEFDEAPEDIDRFTNILDRTLQDINSDYEAKRYKDIALCMPKVHVMKKGTFTEW